MRNFLILIDGLGYDQIRYFRPPGLTALADRLGLTPVTTMLAYSAGIYTGLWSGCYPDESGIWTEFRRCSRPATLSERFLAGIPNRYLSRASQYAIHRLARPFGIRKMENFGIPPALQSQFERTRADYSVFPPFPVDPPPGRRTIPFGDRAAWKYVLCPSIEALTEDWILRMGTEMETLMLAVVELDHHGHALGPFTPQFGEQLRIVDERLRILLQKVEQAWPDVRIAVFSDHGMTPVNRPFDLWGYLSRRGFRLGRDYLAFLHATLACLWFDGPSQPAVRSALQQSGAGHWLTGEEIRSLHLAFPNRSYGDAFFLADEGIELLPNFLSIARLPEKGMHGYHPGISSARAFLIGEPGAGKPDMDIPGLHDALLRITMSRENGSNATGRSR